MDLQTLQLFAVGAISIVALALQVRDSPARKFARNLANKKSEVHQESKA
jgi:hypothetical protein